jgi:multidrug efflux pump
MRRTLGTAVFSGMLGVTLFGIFLTPVFYYVIQWVKDRRYPDRAGPAGQEPSANGEAAGPHPATTAVTAAGAH